MNLNFRFQYTEKLNRELNETINAWAKKWKEQRFRRLSRKEMRNSGELSRSLRYELHRQSEADVKELAIFFRDHGRWLDIRRLKSAKGGDIYLEEIIRWIHSKGLMNDFITDWWVRRGVEKVPKDVERRIAWGIVKSIERKRKRRPWYNKSKQKALNELHFACYDVFKKYSIEELTQTANIPNL